MIIVRFVRNDSHLNEDYYYNGIGEAMEHFLLFLNDNSELYSSIQLVIELYGKEEIALEMKFEKDCK